MLAVGRVRIPYLRFLTPSHRTPIRYRPSLYLSPCCASRMSTTSPIHPVETTQQRSATALDKPHADTNITKNGGTQKVKEKKPKEQSGSEYPLEVRPTHYAPIRPHLALTIFDFCSSVRSLSFSITGFRCSNN